MPEKTHESNPSFHTFIFVKSFWSIICLGKLCRVLESCQLNSECRKFNQGQHYAHKQSLKYLCGYFKLDITSILWFEIAFLLSFN